MVTNSENETVRLLFAILQQKNLKDIDWNQVAESNYLLEPIKNGHAARMRYSRLKDSIRKATDGDECQKGRRTSDKGGITKPRKSSGDRRGSLVKSEYGLTMASVAQLSPASVASSVFTGEGRDDYSAARYITPCSDDTPQGLTTDPVGAGDFPPPGSQFLEAATADESSPSYSAFNAALDHTSLLFNPSGSLPSHLDYNTDLNQCWSDLDEQGTFR